MVNYYKNFLKISSLLFILLCSITIPFSSGKILVKEPMSTNAISIEMDFPNGWMINGKYHNPNRVRFNKWMLEVLNSENYPDIMNMAFILIMRKYNFRMVI